MEHFWHVLNLPVTLPLFVLVVCTMFLSVNNKFNEGLVGVIAIGAIVLGATTVLLMQWTGHWHYEVTETVLLVLWGVALYLVRHTWRFYIWSRNGDSDWNKEGKC